MKFIISTVLLFCSLAITAQNIDKSFLSTAEEYRSYRKELYIDFMPKNIIPEVLRKNFYTDLSPLVFAKNIGQQTYKKQKIQKLYLTTLKAGAGFIAVNKGGLDEFDVANSVVYVYNNDTVRTDNQASLLYNLKKNALQSVKYQLVKPQNILVIKILADR